MDGRVLFAIFAFAWAVLPVGLGIALFRSERRARELERQLRGQGLPMDDERVQQLEQNYESLAKQLNQLAAGQQFLSRLIGKKKTERDSEITPPPAYSSTPH